MDQTTRTLAVMATAILMVAPLVNGILAEAAETADRSFLQEADWEGDPPLPEDYQGDPPEGDPPDELPENATGPAPQPRCIIEEKTPPAAGWRHDSPQNNTGQALFSRSTAPVTTTQEFTVSDEDIGMGILLNVTDARGRITATVYADGERDDPVFSYDSGNRLGDDLLTTSMVTRQGELASGPWVAELTSYGASYDELTYLVVLATCAEAGS